MKLLLQLIICIQLVYTVTNSGYCCMGLFFVCLHFVFSCFGCEYITYIVSCRVCCYYVLFKEIKMFGAFVTRKRGRGIIILFSTCLFVYDERNSIRTNERFFMRTSRQHEKEKSCLLKTSILLWWLYFVLYTKQKQKNNKKYSCIVDCICFSFFFSCFYGNVIWTTIKTKTLNRIPCETPIEWVWERKKNWFPNAMQGKANTKTYKKTT